MSENIKDIGVYRIIHNDSGRFYIGSSKKIKIRFGQHKSALNLGTHHSKYLQSLWNKYGEDSFSFEIIALHETWDEALDAEQIYLNKFFGTSICVNMSGKARMPVLDPDVMRRSRETANSSAIYIESHRNVCLKRNADPIFQAKATEGKRNSLKHKEAVTKNALLLQRPEVVEKNREALRNSTKFKESCIKSAQRMNSDPIILAKCLLATSKKVIGTNIETGKQIEFPSQSAAARWLGVQSSRISECCLGKKKHCRGYVWELK